MAETASMSIATALVRVGYVLSRYAGCDSLVLRVMSAADMDAVEVLANAVRDMDAGAEWPRLRLAPGNS